MTDPGDGSRRHPISSTSAPDAARPLPSLNRPATGVVPAIGLRRGGPADLDAIGALEASCFAPDEGAFGRRQLRALLMNPNAYWLLSTDNLAMACWLKATNGHARWARLYSLAVHPDRRGQGWGQRLLGAGIGWMKREGLATCRAEVRTDNLVARRLYTNWGFRETGQLPGYYGPGIDGVRLVLAADPSRPDSPAHL